MKAAQLTDVRKQFGLRVKALRKEKGYSQESFAFECHIHRAYIGAIERGERNISLDNIAKSFYLESAYCSFI